MTQVIVANPKVLGGTPVFSGTRVPAESLFDYIKHGRTIAFFLEQFPSVQRSQVKAVLEQSKREIVSSKA